jgi:hypothetical protein
MASIKQHFDELPLTDENKKFGEEYLKAVRSNYKECSDRFARCIKSLVAATITLELIAQSAVSEFSFGGLKFNNLYLVEKLLPAVIAYLYYSLSTSVIHRRLFMEIHRQMMYNFQPDYVKNNLYLYAEPPSTFQTERILYFESPNPTLSKWLIWLTYPFLFSVTILPVIYIGFINDRAFKAFGYADPFVWIGLIISITLILQVIIQFKVMEIISPSDVIASRGNYTKSEKT